MRATWYTSILAGGIMGAVAHVLEGGALDGSIVLILFLIGAPVAVIGLPQLREAQLERKRRGSLGLTQEGDLLKYYLPAWGRMFIFFGACILSVQMIERRRAQS